jgi:hypothetical protein
MLGPNRAAVKLFVLSVNCRYQLSLTGVGVEKVQFPQNSEILGDGKCLEKPRKRKSFVGHPDAILFLPISWKGVFQQPRLFASTVQSRTFRISDAPVTLDSCWMPQATQSRTGSSPLELRACEEHVVVAAVSPS